DDDLSKRKRAVRQISAKFGQRLRWRGGTTLSSSPLALAIHRCSVESATKITPASRNPCSFEPATERSVALWLTTTLITKRFVLHPAWEKSLFDPTPCPTGSPAERKLVRSK